MFEKFESVSISQQELIQFLKCMIKLCDVFGIGFVDYRLRLDLNFERKLK